ncbi:MAG: helix-turn-helix domain-containing protein [Alphaproteobacteria bacterium]|nr:helix-turn-helix domain-containing protein [Alphaproteobacteria bacterium]
MRIHSHHILREALAPLLTEERQKRNMLPEQVAAACGLSVENIRLIETGAPVSIKKYHRLMFYYNKKIKIELVDYNTPIQNMRAS